ncbi:hypothetical protein RJT34_04614 [Clitoria ternatea]|uniref:Uncharacterized protein n=1 Tax=Clitoria ternatea TaxID=43366 RepID=A0AAN9KNV8_CLITE
MNKMWSSLLLLDNNSSTHGLWTINKEWTNLESPIFGECELENQSSEEEHVWFIHFGKFEQWVNVIVECNMHGMYIYTCTEIVIVTAHTIRRRPFTVVFEYCLQEALNSTAENNLSSMRMNRTTSLSSINDIILPLRGERNNVYVNVIFNLTFLFLVLGDSPKAVRHI